MATIKPSGEYNKNDEIDGTELTFGEVLGSGGNREILVCLKVLKRLGRCIWVIGE
jgi:hypothetical protein